ncbi:MAG: hypothetical protein ACTSO5_07210 [Candidatus Heimdallarchaeaceae archaeon]
MNKKTPTLPSLYKSLIEFEDEYALFQAKIENIYFWERIRFVVFQKILRQVLTEIGEQQIRTKFTKERRLVFYLRKIRNYLLIIFQFKTNPFFTKKKDILILSHPRRKLGTDEKWWDIYTDFLIDSIEYSTVSIERDLQFQHLKPARTKVLKYLTLTDFLVDLKRYFRLSRLKLKEEKVVFLKKISQEIEARFNVSIDIVHLTKHILTKRKRILPYYYKILKRVQPKLVLVVCSYGKEDFIEACKTLNIPTAELQHGVINKHHVGYSYDMRTAKKATFPDYFLSFGDYWRDVVKYPIDKDKIVSVGFPELEDKRNKLTKRKKKKQILFISQPTSGTRISKFAAELNKEKHFQYEIIYKLHPNEFASWQEDYPWLLDKGIKVIGQKDKNLYELFAESEIQIGVNSTAIFEGLGFGLKTLILDFFGIEYMEDLLESGLAKKVSSVKDLMKIIHKDDFKKIENDHFFKSNSLMNMNSVLKEIIAKQITTSES